MHIPDGFLGPATCATLWGAMLPVWAVASRRVGRTPGSSDGREAPQLGLAGAFCFVVMMFNVPLPGTTSGHAVGAALAAIALGPAAAVIALTVALTIQALV